STSGLQIPFTPLSRGLDPFGSVKASLVTEISLAWVCEWPLEALVAEFSTLVRKEVACLLESSPLVNAQQWWFGEDSGISVTKDCMPWILLKPGH
ncbi:hypothetical protein Ancab_019232, partial [Ancistrocladus abbreviatus]